MLWITVVPAMNRLNSRARALAAALAIALTLLQPQSAAAGDCVADREERPESVRLLVSNVWMQHIVSDWV